MTAIIFFFHIFFLKFDSCTKFQWKLSLCQVHQWSCCVEHCTPQTKSLWSDREMVLRGGHNPPKFLKGCTADPVALKKKLVPCALTISMGNFKILPTFSSVFLWKHSCRYSEQKSQTTKMPLIPLDTFTLSWDFHSLSLIISPAQGYGHYPILLIHVLWYTTLMCSCTSCFLSRMFCLYHSHTFLNRWVLSECQQKRCQE